MSKNTNPIPHVGCPNPLQAPAEVPSQEAAILWTKNVFDGDPPKGFANWKEWVYAPIHSGAYIRAATAEDFAPRQNPFLSVDDIQGPEPEALTPLQAHYARAAEEYEAMAQWHEPAAVGERERGASYHGRHESHNPLLGVDHIRDHQDLWHEPRPNVWMLPAILAVVVTVSVYAALFWWAM